MDKSNIVALFGNDISSLEKVASKTCSWSPHFGDILTGNWEFASNLDLRVKIVWRNGIFSFGFINGMKR